MKVMSVFGTRPEAIKMCPLVKVLEATEGIESVVCLTGQHKEMLQQVIDIFGTKVKYNLNIMKPRQTLTTITSSILEKIEPVLIEEKPDIVLVHGDTTTSFVVALAAFYQQIPVGHVEAGLRTYDKYSPFPEEMNRCLTGRIAELHFAPTENNKNNLLREGINKNNFVTGNTVIDAFQTTVKEDYKFKEKALENVDLKNKKCILMTAHRRENFGEPMLRMFHAIRRIIEKYDDVKMVYPVHLNPLVVDAANKVFGDCDRIKLIKPLEVVEFHNLLSNSYLILTDSGGIQEEAPSLGKPVIVLRDTTERPEGIEAGTLKLAGTEEETIFQLVDELLSDEKEYQRMSKASNPYGDGHASERIADAIIAHFNKAE